jgi:hypothetical protein
MIAPQRFRGFDHEAMVRRLQPGAAAAAAPGHRRRHGADSFEAR